MSATPPDMPTAEELVEYVAQIGRALWAATHLGTPAPAVARLRDRFTGPISPRSSTATSAKPRPS
ncbi:hypothetical protein [Streptomyces sp. NPDC048825]|uniref:hypothetical protein n=1 Tax=Streptomyces sp. NPDC048825 TaxID=3365592 RepID=UPI003722AE6A